MLASLPLPSRVHDATSLFVKTVGDDNAAALLRDATKCALAAAISPRGFACSACRHVATSTKDMLIKQATLKVTNPTNIAHLATFAQQHLPIANSLLAHTGIELHPTIVASLINSNLNQQSLLTPLVTSQSTLVCPHHQVLANRSHGNDIALPCARLKGNQMWCMPV
jgi:hypothetical protein